jgi:hypothetical protein
VEYLPLNRGHKIIVYVPNFSLVLLCTDVVHVQDKDGDVLYACMDHGHSYYACTVGHNTVLDHSWTYIATFMLIVSTVHLQPAFYVLHCSEAAVEEDLRYMLQPSRIYVGESVNVFQRGKYVCFHFTYVCIGI